MKFYLFMCTSLILVNWGFSRQVESPNISTTISSTENTLNPPKETIEKNTEGNLNSIENSTSNGENMKLSENESTTNKLDEQCPSNMQSSPWQYVVHDVKCYCKYPFHPLPINDTCFEFLKQGPCEPSNFLVQPWRNNQGDFPWPQCAPNRCLEDSVIPYNGTCHNILTDPICEDGIFVYMETTSEIECKELDIPRSSIDAPIRRQCAVGSRLDRSGRCRKRL